MTDQPPQARCWAVRTDRAHRDDLLIPELQAGWLRQGWGYAPEQDLRRIRARLRQGAELEADEWDAWSRNRRLLPHEHDGISAGDWLVLPNLPSDGHWILAQAGPRYEYEIAHTGDHGHKRDVTVVRADIDPSALEIAARLRRSMRCQRSLWNMDGLSAEVGRLRGEIPPRRATHTVLADAVSAAEQAAWTRVRQRFGGAELEEPVAMILRRLYDAVDEQGGPAEHGADLMCRSTDPLGMPITVAVQVKMWEGTAADHSPLAQLAQAAVAHPGLTGAVVISTAQAGAPSFERAARSLEQKIGVPVRVIYRRALMRLLVAHASGSPKAITAHDAHDNA